MTGWFACFPLQLAGWLVAVFLQHSIYHSSFTVGEENACWVIQVLHGLASVMNTSCRLAVALMLTSRATTFENLATSSQHWLMFKKGQGKRMIRCLQASYTSGQCFWQRSRLNCRELCLVKTWNLQKHSVPSDTSVWFLQPTLTSSSLPLWL